MAFQDDKLRIIPLGGVTEIGKNMTCFCYRDEILVVDAGLMFPEEDMPGVDIVIPDMTFLEERADEVLGLVLTHGHEDHVGAIPYLLRDVDIPIYGTALTLAIVRNKLEEHKLADVAKLNEVDYGDVIELGSFSVEYFRVSHSIPGAAGLIIRTPIGNIVCSGDFKFDQTPIDGKVANFSRLAEIGDEGVEFMLCDTTNVEKPGFTESESVVHDSLDKIFASAEGRIIVASFASHIHRLQQVFDLAEKYGKKVAVAGRSMESNTAIAEDLGYLTIGMGTRIGLDEIKSYEDDKIVVLTTGSQGEPMSALSRISMDEHKQVKIGEGDTVIISATAIPGNENLVWRTINRLFKRGAKVFYEPYTKVHVSGHGNSEDIKLLVNLVRPKNLIPVHGEYRHYSAFKRLAELMGYDEENIFKLTIGDVLEIDEDGYGFIAEDKVESGMVMVDGLGVGDVEDFVLRDRRHLAHDGIIIIVLTMDDKHDSLLVEPDIITRGFTVDEVMEELEDEARAVVIKALDEFLANGVVEDTEEIKRVCRKAMAKFINEKFRRRPMIVPLIMEI